jgi:hypothetical protein
VVYGREPTAPLGAAEPVTAPSPPALPTANTGGALSIQLTHEPTRAGQPFSSRAANRARARWSWDARGTRPHIAGVGIGIQIADDEDPIEAGFIGDTGQQGADVDAGTSAVEDELGRGETGYGGERAHEDLRVLSNAPLVASPMLLLEKPDRRRLEVIPSAPLRIPETAQSASAAHQRAAWGGPSAPGDGGPRQDDLEHAALGVEKRSSGPGRPSCDARDGRHSWCSELRGKGWARRRCARRRNTTDCSENLPPDHAAAGAGATVTCRPSRSSWRMQRRWRRSA